MTSRRYLNYRRALDLLDAVDPLRFSADRDLLADLAEELLLTRADQPVGKQATQAGGCLVRLVETGALEKSAAEELWLVTWAAGPAEEQVPAQHPVAAEPK